MRPAIAAYRTILGDPRGWLKLLEGGAIWLTVIGWPIVEGYQLESIENSQRGFAIPLPRWDAPGNKAVIGIFALVIDFFYFVLPLLLGGMVIFCGAMALGLSGNTTAANAVAIGISLLVALYLGLIWLTGASAVAKQRYVIDGALQEALGGSIIRDLLRAPARGIYFRARLRSLPPYLLAGLLAWGGFQILPLSGFGSIIIFWLSLSTLLYARLVTIQVYLAATRAVRTRQFDASFEQW